LKCVQTAAGMARAFQDTLLHTHTHTLWSFLCTRLISFGQKFGFAHLAKLSRELLPSKSELHTISAAPDTTEPAPLAYSISSTTAAFLVCVRVGIQ